MDIAGQVFSILGMIFTVLSFQMKTKKQIFVFQTVGSALFLISFYLLDSMTAVYLNVVFLTRNVVFSFRDSKKWANSKVWLYVFIVLVTVAGIAGYKTPIDILPIIGSAFATIAMYMRRENTFRLVSLAASPCWLAYNLLLPSIGGAICEIFNMLSSIIGLIRYRKDGIFKQKG